MEISIFYVSCTSNISNGNSDSSNNQKSAEIEAEWQDTLASAIVSRETNTNQIYGQVNWSIDTPGSKGAECACVCACVKLGV